MAAHQAKQAKLANAPTANTPTATASTPVPATATSAPATVSANAAPAPVPAAFAPAEPTAGTVAAPTAAPQVEEREAASLHYPPVPSAELPPLSRDLSSGALVSLNQEAHCPTSSVDSATASASATTGASALVATADGAPTPGEPDLSRGLSSQAVPGSEMDAAPAIVPGKAPEVGAIIAPDIVPEVTPDIAPELALPDVTSLNGVKVATSSSAVAPAATSSSAVVPEEAAPSPLFPLDPANAGSIQSSAGAGQHSVASTVSTSNVLTSAANAEASFTTEAHEGEGLTTSLTETLLAWCKSEER